MPTVSITSNRDDGQDMYFFSSDIQLNDGIFMLDMNMDSQSAIMGFVAA